MAVQKNNFRRLLRTVEALSDLGPEMTAERDFSQTSRSMLGALMQAVFFDRAQGQPQVHRASLACSHFNRSCRRREPGDIGHQSVRTGRQVLKTEPALRIALPLRQGREPGQQIDLCARHGLAARVEDRAFDRRRARGRHAEQEQKS